MPKTTVDAIKLKIFLARGKMAMLDVDAAALYGLDLPVFLNVVIKAGQLPEDFVMRLNKDELPQNKMFQDSFLYVLTEGGMLMLPALFTDDKYVELNIAVLRAIKAFREQHSIKLLEKKQEYN